MLSLVLLQHFSLRKENKKTKKMRCTLKSGWLPGKKGREATTVKSTSRLTENVGDGFQQPDLVGIGTGFASLRQYHGGQYGMWLLQEVIHRGET